MHEFASIRFVLFALPALVFTGAEVRHIRAEESPIAGNPVASYGPTAALNYEKKFRKPGDDGDWTPIPLNQCENITELNRDFWSKRDVLTDFKRHRTQQQVGVIVFVKTEYCCDDSRLCAVTTACFEKKSTPLVDRFRIYAGWIKNHPDRELDKWEKWDTKIIREYAFKQGPGARIVVMIPTWDGSMYQWQSTARDLDLAHWQFEASNGEAPELTAFLKTALKFAPAKTPLVDPWNH